MEVVRAPEYIEEIPLLHLKPEQYLAAAYKAATGLHWLIVALNEQAFVCHTPGNDFSAGDVITITAETKKATIHSQPLSEYYGDDTQNRLQAKLLRQVIANILAEQEKTDRSLHPMHREKYGALIPSKSYIATPLILYINVLLFLAMVIAGVAPLQPTPQSLFQWGGNLRMAVAGGQWWRLITYMFLHAGALHILMNSFALLYIGMFLEPLMGRFRYVSAYLLTGVCAGLVSIAVHSNSVGVGASGAIFGLYGVFLSVLTTSHIQKTMRKTMLRGILFFVVYNLMAGLQGNTDNAAHIGGLISGFIIGYAYYPGIANHATLSRQMGTTAIVLACVVLTAFVMVEYWL